MISLFSLIKASLRSRHGTYKVTCISKSFLKRYIKNYSGYIYIKLSLI